MDKLKIVDADIALIAVSTIPFLGVTAPVVTLTHARFEGFFLGAIAMAGLCAIIAKPIFGWRQTLARIVLMASGLWGIVGSGHQEYAIVIPFGAGTLAQWCWMIGVVGFIAARYDMKESGDLGEGPAELSAVPEKSKEKVRLIR